MVPFWGTLGQNEQKPGQKSVSFAPVFKSVLKMTSDIMKDKNHKSRFQRRKLKALKNTSVKNNIVKMTYNAIIYLSNGKDKLESMLKSVYLQFAASLG